jgi:hypothetical protein
MRIRAALRWLLVVGTLALAAAVPLAITTSAAYAGPRAAQYPTSAGWGTVTPYSGATSTPAWRYTASGWQVENKPAGIPAYIYGQSIGGYVWAWCYCHGGTFYAFNPWDLSFN